MEFWGFRMLNSTVPGTDIFPYGAFDQDFMREP